MEDKTTTMYVAVATRQELGIAQVEVIKETPQTWKITADKSGHSGNFVALWGRLHYLPKTLQKEKYSVYPSFEDAVGRIILSAVSRKNSYKELVRIWDAKVQHLNLLNSPDDCESIAKVDLRNPFFVRHTKTPWTLGTLMMVDRHDRTLLAGRMNKFLGTVRDDEAKVLLGLLKTVANAKQEVTFNTY